MNEEDDTREMFSERMGAGLFWTAVLIVCLTVGSCLWNTKDFL